MAKLMMCLSCGANFKTEQEAIDHNEKYKQLEQETRWVLTATVTARYYIDVNGVMREDEENRPVYIPAHQVQISDPVGIK